MWDVQSIKGMEELAREKAKKILAEHRPQPLDENVVKEIDSIVEKAKKFNS
jgi:trimethylamine:corrinoid methyltransferase-like protein